MTLAAPDVVETYNKPGSGCGFGGGWVLGQPRNVLSATCPPLTFPAAGTRIYDRVWIEGDTLRAGISLVPWANTSPDKRPAVPGALVFTRVKDGA